MSDLTFFTNDGNTTLLDRFTDTLRFVQYFDVLVGYFRTSGFYLLEDALASVEKIRILVGLNLDSQAYEIIDNQRGQMELPFTHVETIERFTSSLTQEMERSEDREDVERGVRRFIEMLECGQLEIKAHPSHNIHAKVYISRFNRNNSPDFGRVITGSSNFSQSGFQDQYEFNVELKNRSDVDYALSHFEQLWAEAVDVNQTYVETIRRKTWLNDRITPYELYLKLLYEYFKEDINIDQDYEVYLPHGFMELAYQKQAVVAARKILDVYNGVFLSDVVGLGKTFIAALLAQQLPGRKLIICPPVLEDYWKETFYNFGVTGFRVESLGKLDRIHDADRYQYVFVDEAHRFRNELTQGYERLHNICWGRKVILVSATPLNNTIMDIFNQLKLFQNPRQSAIPGLANLEGWFNERRLRLQRLTKGTPEYVAQMQQVAREIRERILDHVMVRRTRTDIVRYFSDDITAQGLTFPSIDDPHSIAYRFDERANDVFMRTLDELQSFHYARYTPLLYLTHGASDLEQQSQRNLRGFMKSMLVKRLDSSFHAFRLTINRFIQSYERFLHMAEGGTIFISKKINVYDYLERDDEQELLRLVDEDRVSLYPVGDFDPTYFVRLQEDLALLQRIADLWQTLDEDPKLQQLLSEVEENPLLHGQKMIIFTESAETGAYLHRALEGLLPGKVCFYSSNDMRHAGRGMNRVDARRLIERNFDPSADNPENEIQILIATDVLSEGINLHRANIIINYDLPWNPTRVLQRVGRVNRVGTHHPMIEIFNFFPTSESDDELGLEANIKAKLHAFQNLLGEDARYLTDEEEVASFEMFGDRLYERLTNRGTYEAGGEDERSDLEYLRIIREVRDGQPDLFARLKQLPKKARSARGETLPEQHGEQLLTFFRRGRVKKFFLSSMNPAEVVLELSFLEAADRLRCQPDEPRVRVPSTYYDLLTQNKEAFENATSPAEDDATPGGGRTNRQYLANRLRVREFRNHPAFTDEDDEFIRLLGQALESGLLPNATAKRLKQSIERLVDPLPVLQALRNQLPVAQLQTYFSTPQNTPERREVILSEMLI